MSLARVLRLTVTTLLVGGGVSVLAPGTASAAAVNATVVNVVDTAAWPVPSPDPSGITYDSVNGRLIVGDAEVDEMPIYQDVNLFVSTLAGVQVPPGGTSLPWTDEPTGVAFRPSDRNLFVSDDDEDEIYQVAPGADAVHGTADDSVVTLFSTDPSGNSDPEDLALDFEVTPQGDLLVIDGSNKEVFKYEAGGDNRLGTNDDSVSHFDVEGSGARDPEGIAYHYTRGTILVLDHTSQKIYEYSRTNTLLNTINIAPAGMLKAAGLAVAPPSAGTGEPHLYVVDRGIDNNDVPTENDGKIFELAVSLPPVGDGGGGTPVNAAPVVSAGDDRAVTMPSAASLAGAVTDDGLPSGTLSITWTKATGPGTVTFTDRNSAATTATFSVAGTYVLRLKAYDGALSSTDTMTVVVSPTAGSGTNAAPVVNAGADQAVTMPNAASLAGSVTDDGLPNGSALTIAWSKTSGPGTVRFANKASASTTATFSVAGTYVLRLRASDGALATVDTVTVVASSGSSSGTNAAPVVSAGPDRTVTMPGAASLQGSVNDDGLPAGSTLTITWSKSSGPGTVRFANKASASTTATFSLPGTYVLRLRASDGALAKTDTVTVIVS